MLLMHVRLADVANKRIKPWKKEVQGWILLFSYGNTENLFNALCACLPQIKISVGIYL